MHRTTTTAALLVTVTVSALSGCVTVQRPAAPGPPGTARSLPSVPRPDGSTVPRVVQAPAKEALEMVGPSRTPTRSVSTAPHAPAAAPPAPQRPPVQRAVPSHPRSHRSRDQHVGVPDAARSVPKAPDVCALGKQYGGWSADSPQARICEQTYGR
ncbi:hypothetical protein [Streptomyces sp. NPDC048277]|uniref:hypothetical protein n=1 Tax=Streptomyces sp. NPDC048277 TaxID=3155027 RepID=UPI0033D62CB8